MKKGLGDKVEAVTKATGIKKIVETFANGKDCGCESRKQRLNNVTLSSLSPSGCLTEELYMKWSDFKKRSPKELKMEDQQLICDIVREVWAMSFAPCPSCSSSVWTERIKKIDAIHATYEEENKKPVNRGKPVGDRKRGQTKKADGLDKKP